MKNHRIRFLSRNEFKRKEATDILAPNGITVVGLDVSINELQTTDTRTLVYDKVVKAFARSGRPLFVEHTGLELCHLNGLPGGLTQVFWDALEADRFAELFGTCSVTNAIARTTIGFTDGKQFVMFEGSIHGRITPEPRGPRGFQWDCVFQPDGNDKTFAEMGEYKNEISMWTRRFPETPPTSWR